LANLTQGRTAAKQIGGKGVPQQVGTFELWVQAGTPQRTPNDAANGDGACKTL
jgi:hypothetical protein